MYGGSEGRGGSLVAAARHARFSRGAGSTSEGHFSFAFDLFELDEKRPANHAHGDDLAVLGGQLALVRCFNLRLFGWRFGVGSNGSKWAQSLT